MSSHTSYHELIKRHAADKNALYQKLREAYERRDASDLARKDWSDAAKRFRSYRSQVDELLEWCLESGVEWDANLRRFAFDYAEVDPYYFRSGYDLEKLLRKMKKLKLTDAEVRVLQGLLLRRIDTRAYRNFRDICRMMPLIETDEFAVSVFLRLRDTDPSVMHRAGLAVTYLSASDEAPQMPMR